MVGRKTFDNRSATWLAFAALLALTTVLVVLTRSTPVEAFETGQVLHNGNPDNGALLCTECHAPGAPTAEVEITGPNQLTPGETGTFTVTVTGGPGIVGGFNLSSTDHLGSLGTLDADTRLFFSEITHTEPKALVDGAATFDFTWTAPADAQPITLYAAGVSANGDGTNSGDSVASGTLAIEVADLGGGNPRGDVDGDGDADAADVRAVLDTSVGREPQGFDLDAGDLNDDGRISLIDALLLARLIN